MSGLFNLELDTTVILCDNQSCIKMTENPVFHDKSKHIEIRYFYIWDMMQKGAIKLQYVSTDKQVADVLTKPLSWVMFEHFREKLGFVHKELPQKGGQWCCSGIVSSLGIFPKVIWWPRSSRMNKDCIISGHLSIMDPVTSILENVVRLYHPWNLVQNGSSDFDTRERGRIVSSLNFSSKRIQWLWYSRIW